MRTVFKLWLPLLGALSLAALVYLVANWSSLSTTHKLSLLVTIVLVVHMTEEEHLPGGFGYMFNVIVRRSDAPDRYPMSPLIAMLVDVLIWVFLFVPAIFFPHTIWLGMAPMFLAIGELLMHTGIGFGVQYRRHRHLGFYTPGLVTAWILGAIGITYIVVISKDGLMSGLDWLWAVLYWIGNMVVFLLIPENVIASRATPWAFPHNDEYLGYYKRFTTVEAVFADSVSRAST